MLLAAGILVRPHLLSSRDDARRHTPTSFLETIDLESCIVVTTLHVLLFANCAAISAYATPGAARRPSPIQEARVQVATSRSTLM